MSEMSADGSQTKRGRVKIFQADRAAIMRELWNMLHRIRKLPPNAATPWGSRSTAIRCLTAKLHEHAKALEPANRPQYVARSGNLHAVTNE
jgi:hypothetical protein